MTKRALIYYFEIVWDWETVKQNVTPTILPVRRSNQSQREDYLLTSVCSVTTISIAELSNYELTYYRLPFLSWSVCIHLMSIPI